MFAEYDTVVVRAEFTSGMSGSRVLDVRPIHSGGPDLPVVVKVDVVDAIAHEWQAYRGCIQNKLSGVAAIQGEPVYPPGNPMGGLRYQLAGDGVFEVISLADYLREKPLDEIETALPRLFTVMNTLWEQKDVKPDLYLQTTYDSFLPVNLVIEVTETATNSNPKWLAPASARQTEWKVGDTVQLSGFGPVEINKEKNRLLLNNPDPERSFRFYLTGVPDVGQFFIGEPIQQPLTGVIQETRHTLLSERARLLLPSDADLTAGSFPLDDGSRLSNPLVAYQKVLTKSFDANVACIHGDLHLQNIMVEPDGGLSYLIDFGKSRRDHVIRDLIHMEINLMTTLLPESLNQADLSPVFLLDFYTRLHCVVQGFGISVPADFERPFAILRQIRLAARPYLFKPEKWQEYYFGLGLSLLSALKFKNLTRTACQAAFWGAAIAFQFDEAGPDCTDRPPGMTLATVASLEFSEVESSDTMMTNNLPTKTYHQLIGRSKEMEDILNALRSPDRRPMVAIVGLGGMGKTALAREIMGRCQQDEFFVHTVWTSAKTEHFIGGRAVQGEEVTYDLDSVLGDIGRQCQRLDIATMSLEQKKLAVNHLLATKRTLIMLDNLETVPDSEQLVQSLFDILGDSKLLITSRHQVQHDRTYTVNLGGFPEEDGIAFLNSEGRERNISAVAEAPFKTLLEIHEKTGGAPLAMKLVVGQLSQQPMEAVLISLQEASAKGQDYNFYRFVYWYSWYLLDDTARMALVDMSVFPPMTGGAAQDVEEVSQLAAGDFWTAIGRLVTMSLVDKLGLTGQERYALHALTHYFILADITEEWAE